MVGEGRERDNRDRQTDGQRETGRDTDEVGGRWGKGGVLYDFSGSVLVSIIITHL